MKKLNRKLPSWWGAMVAAALLSACGGGGGSGGEPPTPPTPLPDTLSVTAPATAESTSELQFGSSAPSTAGLSFGWDFGDGKTSTETSPKHQYAKGGDYDVKLTVSNAAGASKTEAVRVSITNLNNVRGLQCSKSGDGGWCWQQPLPHGNVHTDSFFASKTTLFVTGEHGELSRSTDGGVTWSIEASGSTKALRAVSFVSAKHGWVMGDDPSLLRTTDGGVTWSRTAPVPVALQAGFGGRLVAVDDQIAIVGTTGLHTTDGGATWARHDFFLSDISSRGTFWGFSGTELRRSTDFGRTSTVVLDLLAHGNGGSAFFNLVDDQTMAAGWALSTFDPATVSWVATYTLLLSFDGGDSWRRVDPSTLDGNAMPSSDGLRIIRASAADRVLLASLRDQLISSSDGGTHWSTVRLPALSAATGEGALAVGTTVLVPSRGPLIWRPSELGGEYAERGLAWSGDGGQTWSSASVEGLSKPTYAAFKRLRQVDGNVFSMQDSTGRAFLSTDGGRNWTIAVDAALLRNDLPSSPWFGEYSMKLAFLDAKRGLGLDATGQLRQTSDGGRTWTTKPSTGLPSTATNTALRFVDDKIGWMLQSDGRLYKTSDGGATWRDGQLVHGGLVRFDFVDANRGWGEPTDRRGLVFTRDGGQTWMTLSPPQTVSVGGLFFGDGRQIVIYGRGTLLASTVDDGQTWTVLAPNVESPFNTRSKVIASDAKTWWSAQTFGLYRSDDAGATWTEVTGVSGQFADIAFADANNGWAVGRGGMVVATTDGGKTWVRQPTQADRDLWRIQTVDSKTAWIEGEAGTVLATGNGGR
ncbi:YCF48-related protein [Roseateles sp. P5_D6]